MTETQDIFASCELHLQARICGVVAMYSPVSATLISCHWSTVWSWQLAPAQIQTCAAAMYCTIVQELVPIAMHTIH